jgi:UDP-glucose 4-epimerase
MSLAGRNCLVLGAGGFIGGHLTRALAQAGAEVHGFGHRAAPPAVPEMRFTEADFTDLAALTEALQGMDIVFHLLGGINLDASARDPIADLMVNTVASVRLFDRCREAGVRKIVYVSSGGTVYGVPKSLPIREADATDPISAYGINKLMVEKYLQLSTLHGGPQALSLRVANPFGEFQNPFRRQGLIAALIATIQAGRPVEIWGDGQVIRDYLYAGDVAAALVAASLYDGPEQILNVGSGIGRSVLDVLDSVCEALGQRPVAVIHKPARAADVPANILDISTTQRALGWAPRTDWMEGLRRSAAWIAVNYPPVYPQVAAS